LASLFASAGAAGIILGLAARPVLSNLLAGIQIAMTPPIRVEDQVVIEGEFGSIETIASNYVVGAALGPAANGRAAHLFHRKAVSELDL
jgi:small-conductance mechanosensitive channel